MRVPLPFGGRTHLERSPPEIAVFIALGAALSVAAVVGVSWAAGFGLVAARFRHVDGSWLPIALAAEALAYLGYALAYREVARVDGGPRLAHGRALALVATGFGAFVARGGFAVDLHHFKLQFDSHRDARVRVLGLGALEYALLAPAACIVAILMLLDNVHRPDDGLTLPWAIAVPVGGILALTALRLRERLHGRRGWRDGLAQWLDSLHVLRQLFLRLDHLAAPIGTGLYWFGDIACLWLCLRAFEGHFPSVGPLLIGYATGYALTRRTLPLAGAGAVEALLPFALSWSGTPLAAAVPAVVAYRIVNFWLPIVPAMFGLRSLRAGDPVRGSA
ncbi:MAG TPA: lysylphosphatidylglycerol synthase domain-containing protein [Gaiellaceae bacterium]